MSYEKLLKEKINKLKQDISNNVGEISALEKELQKLEMKAFEEDLSLNDNVQLLKG